LKIRKLCIPFHTIQKFPYWFSEFSSLEVLEIGGGGRHVEKIFLPDSLESLKALRRLTCARLGWSEIPPWVYELKELRYLDIAGNKLKMISSEFSRLQNLEQLKIEYNPLEEFPVALNQMGALKEVAVDFRQKKAWKEKSLIPLHLALQASLSWE
jgi:Leucine-rich repeat (LRR) protein